MIIADQHVRELPSSFVEADTAQTSYEGAFPVYTIYSPLNKRRALQYARDTHPQGRVRIFPLRTSINAS
jgi:hypothetical protein